MRKTIVCIIFALLLFISGCGKKNIKTTISYTFNVETGDNIIVSLKTNDGYKLSSDIPFTISKGKESLSQGTFIFAEYYNAYIDSVKNDDKAKIIDQGNKNNCSYVMWNYNDSEFNYVIMIEGTNTGVLLGNNVSEESAKECFDRLEIKVDK